MLDFQFRSPFVDLWPYGGELGVDDDYEDRRRGGGRDWFLF